MPKDRLQIQIFHEPGVLRIEHCTTQDRATAFGCASALILPALFIGLARQAVSGWNTAATLAAVGLSFVLIVAAGLLFAMSSYGTLRIRAEDIETRGYGAASSNGDRILCSEIEYLELSDDLHRIPGDDDFYVRGLHAVSGRRRLCLLPDASPENANLVLEEILQAAPQLRSRIRWETLRRKL